MLGTGLCPQVYVAWPGVPLRGGDMQAGLCMWRRLCAGDAIWRCHMAKEVVSGQGAPDKAW